MTGQLLYIGSSQTRGAIARASELAAARLAYEGMISPEEADVVVFGDGSGDVLTPARDLLQKTASLQIVFLLPGAKLEKIRASLPFVPRLASAWTADVSMSPQALAEVLKAALAAASRGSALSLLKDRINQQIGQIHRSDAQNAEDLRARQLLVSESYLATLLSQAPDAFLAVDPEGRITAWNTAAARLFGVASTDAVGNLLVDVLPSEVAGDLARGAAQTQAGQPVAGLDVHLGQGSDAKTLETNFAAIKGSDQDTIGVSISLHDETERMAAERRLRESELRFRTVTESLPQLVWTCDPDGNCNYFSKQWIDYTGVEETRQLGLAWLELVIHPEDRERTREHWFGAVEGRHPYDIDYRIKGIDGTYRWFKTRGTPIRSSDGTITHWFGTCTDIQEIVEAREALLENAEALEQRVAAEIGRRSEVEEALRQAQKMEALGQLTGGVAHDFNNLLQVISGNLHLLTKDVAGNERAERRVANALAGVSRGSKLANQLLAFGRRQALAPRVINVSRLISNMGDMLRRSLGEAVEIELIVANGQWNTMVDPVQIENAILNLAINARDAMDGRGKLAIEVANAILDEDYAGRNAEVTPGQYVMISVTDTGSGMPPEVLEKVFQPFFSTKPVGKGTGLGLSMVYGFVKQSGGHVKIDSKPGRGTTVRLYLPRSTEAEEMPEHFQADPVTEGTETILVAEDDDEVRDTVVDLLSELGYRVVTAKDAAGALAILHSGMPIDLLFTDVIMPGSMRGPELAKEAKELVPGIVVLFTSGYTQNGIIHDNRMGQGIDLLSKPYSREDLAQKIRQALDQKRQDASPRSGE